jgi:lysophospholipase L1-like esterase
MIPRLLFLLWTASLLATSPLAGAQESPQKWEKDIAAFEQADKKTPPEKGGILFIGSSSIRMWTTLAKDFPNHNVLNRGFGGSQISDAVQYVDRIVFPYEPRMIVMYSGGNDLNAGESPEQVAGDFRTFTEKVREKLPNTRIMYISITGNPARWAQVDKVKATNAMVAKYCQETPGLTFINVFDRMLKDDGQPRPEIFLPDGLHMNAAGYELWRDIVGPYLGAADRKEAPAPAPKAAPVEAPAGQ